MHSVSGYRDRRFFVDPSDPAHPTVTILPSDKVHVVTTGVDPATNRPGTDDRGNYTITVTANIELRDTQKNTVLWSNPSLAVREEYDATGTTSAAGATALDPSSFFNQESNAVERVSTEFARSVVASILEAF